jgi:hypothetical protein
MSTAQKVGGCPGLQPSDKADPYISSPDLAVVNILRDDFGFKLKDKSLDNRLIEASGPQGGSASAPKSEFQSSIDVAKYKMGFFTRCLILLKTIIKCLIWVKTIIPRDYGLEFAKQVLNKLIQTCKSNGTDVISGNVGFLKAVLGAIALPGNEDDIADNIKHLLRLSKGKIATIDIINEFKNIGDVDRRIAFLGKLQENLSGEEKTEFKEFLAGALDGIADQIEDEFNNNQNIDIDKDTLLTKLESVNSLRNALLADKSKIPHHLLSRGPAGLAVVKTLIENGKLRLEQFSPDEAKEFVDALLANSSSGADYVIELIDDSSGSKLPKLASPNEVKTRAFQFQELYSTFEHGITEAFLGETSNAGDKPWEAIRSQLSNLTLAKASGIWQTIANKIAASCFDKNGEIDSEKLKALMVLLGNEKIFKTEPYSLIPNAEHMRSQMHTVCESLLNLNNQSQALASLNAAKGITVGQHERAILAAMKLPEGSTPAVAILSSLFTPHRQKSLPTSTIDSLINAEIRNNPERLIEMYRQMLVGDQFTLPSGHKITQQKIGEGSITVDLSNGGVGKDAVFRDITSGDPYKVSNRKDLWQAAGITYPVSENQADKYKLGLPVHNMNDILFANFFQASNFGNSSIKEDQGGFGTMSLYAGQKKPDEIYASALYGIGLFSIHKLSFLDEMEKLIGYAKEQQKLGHNYMRVREDVRVMEDGKEVSIYHSENIDINALLALDLNNMETGRAYPIGDRNLSSSNMSHDIPRLAIRKVGNTPPTYEFGILSDGSAFKKIDVAGFDVYTPGIQKQRGWFWRLLA